MDIHGAAYWGELEELDRLLEEDPDLLEARVDFSWHCGEYDLEGATPLIVAAAHGHDPVVARLLDLGADTFAVTDEGELALHAVCYDDHASTLSLLLDAGAPHYTQWGIDYSPLRVAASYGSLDCLDVLLSRFRDVLVLDSTDWAGLTVLHEAAGRDKDDVLEKLLDAGANPTIFCPYWFGTPLNLARASGSQRCAFLLESDDDL